jgi:hypothetical protein
MSTSPAVHQRRSIRLKGYDYAQAGAAALACIHLSPHQHRAESFILKRDAGEGNQKGGGHERIEIFLIVKLFIFKCSGHFQHPHV